MFWLFFRYLWTRDELKDKNSKFANGIRVDVDPVQGIYFFKKEVSFLKRRCLGSY